MTTRDDVIILTHKAYVQLRSDLKAAGLDLCYMAQAGAPLRLDWSEELFSDPKFLEQLDKRRPADANFPIASVTHSRNGGWLRPDEFMVTFHGVGVLQEDKLQQYLTEHQIQSSTQAPKEQLSK